MKDNGTFDSSYLKPLGLFKEGDHGDTHITATAPNANPVELEVDPVRIEGGTIFVPKRGQEGLIQLFPPSQRTRRVI